MQDAHAFVDSGLALLARSLDQRGSELRNVQLATVSPEARPGLRTAVLRAFERSPARAELHSDARAAKVREIAYSAHVAILAWSSTERLQLRLEGLARLHRGDDFARARWDGLSANARKPYGTAAVPGTPVGSPDDPAYLPDEERFQQFTVISVTLSTVDILRLEDEGGQTRAFGRFTPSSIEASWIVA